MKAALIALLLATLVAACATGAPVPAQPVGRPATPAADLAKTLEAHRWKLESAADTHGRRIEAVEPASGRALTFAFSGSRLSIQGGCNQLSGGYRIDDAGQLSIGRMAATLMACEAAAMQRDAALTALLAQPMLVDLGVGPPPVLRLQSPSGERLVLTGEATPEARYGPGTLMFLEVAAQMVACATPSSAAAVCLQVRERHYDKQGLVVGTPGEWRPFPDRIEGFTHQAGERKVLRVKRFERGPAAAGGSAFVYVLDLVIESETVRPQ